MSSHAVPATQVVTKQLGVVGHLVQVWRYRELLVGLVRKELKVKYKNSSLGFAWSLVNPLLYLVVFYLAFQVFLQSGIPSFSIFLLSGLLVWNFYSTSLSAATNSIVGNASLVNKVYFPRTILPLASVGASLVHFFLQSLVLFVALAVVRWDVPWAYLWLIVPALVVLLVLTSALSILLSSVNVYARDTQHLLELALLAWFWMTPIVYQYRLVSDRFDSSPLLRAFVLNPITHIVLAFQRGIYGVTEKTQDDGSVLAILPGDAGQLWYLRNLAIVGVVAVLLLIFSLKVFSRSEGNFAEEL